MQIISQNIHSANCILKTQKTKQGGRMPDPNNEGQFGNREDTEEQASQGGQNSNQGDDSSQPQEDTMGEERTDGEPRDNDLDDDTEEEENR
jgi:uncharacterized protein